MKKTKIAVALSAGTVGLALVFSGCAAPATPKDDGPGASSSPTAPNSADEMFVMGMIPHHEQAIEMSDIVLAKEGIDPDVAELAQKIKDAQGPEIEQMSGWLEEWGVDAESNSMEGMDHGSMGEGGEGMMSDSDIDALKNADAAQASRLFLEQMIVHHEGAVEMARTELDKGQLPTVRDLAQRVIDDQTAEIDVMRDLLSGL